MSRGQRVRINLKNIQGLSRDSLLQQFRGNVGLYLLFSKGNGNELKDISAVSWLRFPAANLPALCLWEGH